MRANRSGFGRHLSRECTDLSIPGKMRACFAIISVTRAADVVFQCKKRVFHPGVADLFKALVVIGPTAHPIKVLRNTG